MSDETPTNSQTEESAVDTAAAKPKAAARDPVLTERDQLLARMDAQIEERRKAEEAEFLASAGENPEAWILHKRMQAEAKGQPLETATPPSTDETAEPTDLEDGTESVEAMHEPPPPPVKKPAVAPAQRVSQKGEDPLGEYVVRVDGKPMFRTLVDGREELIPLDRARAQLQKHVAADVRLQQIAQQRKELDARAAQLKKTEAELATRRAVPAQPVEDPALDAEAADIVRSLVTEPEDKAAARLAQTLKKIRQAATPQIDVEAITKQAADVARQTVAEERQHLAYRDGFNTFTKDYKDIASDPELFAIADRKTDAIAAEHPEWSPGEVMLEAGKQTREWLTSMGLKPAAPTPQPSNRQQRKEGLRPIPTPRTARPVAVPEESTGRQNPSEVVAEMRKARGQFS